MRLKISAAIAVSATALLLAGCAGQPSGGGTSTATASASATSKGCVAPKPGAVSSSVDVVGAEDAEPTVTFDKPLKATSTQRSYVTKGTGPEARKGSTVDVALVAYNGTSGARLTSNGYAGSSVIPITVGDTSMIPGLTEAVECAPVGSRLVTTASAKDAWGGADPSAVGGLKSTDTVVFVVDVLDAVPSKADGAPQSAQHGFPAVRLASDGTPAVTIPKGAKPPAQTRIEVLKKGAGEAVAASDTVMLQYQGVLWRTGKVFDQSWGKAPITNSVTGFVPGFTKALEGQTVGSQVLVVIPPADGYGSAGQPQAGIKGTDTLVFVIDILKAYHS